MVFRGRGRGRGGRGGGFQGGPGGPMGGGPMMGQYSMRPPFDLTLCEPMFPRTKEVDDTTFTQALLKRNDALAQSATEQTAIANLISKVNAAIEKIIVAPELFTAAAIEEVRQVGSYKKGTMMARNNKADLVVVLKTLPTVEAVTALGNYITEDIKKSDPGNALGCVPRDYGCEIAATQAVVRLMITTIPQNMKKLEPDLHLDADIMRSNVSAIFHARWYEENATHSTIKVLVRLLKDVRSRFAGLKPLNVWALELLSHYAVMNTPNRQPLPINLAFRRVLQLLAAGIFLPGSAGLVDPCERGSRVQQSMSYEEMDQLCSTAQTLLRVLCHGGYKQILGLEGTASVATEMSVWEGVVVTPLERAYDEKEMFPDEGMDDEDMGDEGESPTKVEG